MTLAEFAARYDDFYAPRFVLRLGGAPYDGGDATVASVSVEAAAEKADRFSFTVEGAYEQGEGGFADLDWGAVATDTTVEIAMGYGTTTETLLVGTVAEHRPSFPARGSPTVEVSGYGLMHELRDGTAARTWDDATDAEVAEAVAGEYRFDRVEVAPTDTRHPKVVQDDETDLAFLRRLADRNGTDAGSYQVTVRRDAFRFGPAPDDEAPTATLSYGDALRSFSPEYRTGGQVGSVEVRGYSATDAEGVTGTADSDGPGSGTEVVRRPVRSTAEAETAARARLGEIEDQRLSGRGESVGLPEITAGKPLALEGLGERFSKTYYVETATHRADTDGYTTSFSVRLADGEAIE